MVIDPSEAAPVLRQLTEMNLRAGLILNTHHHHDHIGGDCELAERYGCDVYVSERDRDRVSCATHALKDGDTFIFDSLQIETIAIPGHTDGQIAFYLPEAKAIFVGDTLFSFGCGRLFEGTAEQMWSSLSKLMRLPGDTRLYFGHEYTETNYRFAKTVDPLNKAIDRRFEESRHWLKEKGYPPAPTLTDEMQVNPFLRASKSEIKKQLGTPQASDLEAFTTLRLLKDAFR